MNRRRFLASLLLSASSLPLLGTAARAGEATLRVIIALTDIGPATNPNRLALVLDGLIQRAVPFSCVVTIRARGQSLSPRHPVSALLRDAATRHPGLVELMPKVEGLHDMRPFAQARASSEARAELIRALNLVTMMTWSDRQIGTIATEAVEDPIAPGSIRGSGIRTVLALSPTNAPIVARQAPNGVLDLMGGIRSTFGAGLRGLPQNPDGQLQTVVLLSANTFSAQPKHQLRADLARFGNIAGGYERQDRLVMFQISDLSMRIDPNFDRKLALHLFDADPEDSDGAEAIEEMATILDEAGIPFSRGQPLAGFGQGVRRQAYWVGLKAPAAPSREPLTKINWRPERNGRHAYWHSPARREPGLPVVLDYGNVAFRGLSDRGDMHLPVAAHLDRAISDAEIQASVGLVDDCVLAISASGAARLGQRRAILGALTQLSKDQITRIMPLDELARTMLPDDTLLADYLRTETFLASNVPASVRRKDRLPDDWREDAQAAWSYIERATDRSTGLCSSTTAFAVSRQNPAEYVTMWDVGSHIKGLIGACKLGLIETDDFDARIAKLLGSIGQAAQSRNNLPPEEIRYGSTRGTSNFNGIDTCRLLSGLHDLRLYRDPEGLAAELVDSLDIEQILIDGRLHSRKSGEWVSDYGSTYMDHAALALRAWGFDVASPYDEIRDLSTSDDRMALLATHAQFGPVAAEPALLELIDFGERPQAAYLADVLLAAQIEEFERSGRLLFPSESPIDRSPWFTYQGFRLAAEGDPWTVQTTNTDAAYTTEDFVQRTRAGSPKAAYLWAILRPHPHSFLLRDLTRTIGRTPYGFVSAIYSQSGRPTENYADINTNGIILQAITSLT